MNPADFDSVADSTDWLSTPLSGLSNVEAALRCQICKDFYKTPMLTSCNHTFCSLCIRRALSSDGKCPLCRASEQEMKLRSNWSMEEVVAAFTQARSAILDIARRPSPSPLASAISETPKRRIDDIDDNDDDIRRSSKRLRSSTRLSKTRGMEVTAEMARQESDVPDLEPIDLEPDDGLVACPICWRRMKPVQVDRHIDASCPGPQPKPTSKQPSYRNSTKPTSITSAFTSSATTTYSTSASNKQQTTQPSPERLPTLNYSMIKDTQLRRELADLGLSTSGNRTTLERRHREWVMIWNANCDSQRPRRPAELLRDLDAWERTLGSRAPMASRAAHTGAQIRDKDFDGAAWASKHDTSFRELIANARRTRAQTRAQTGEDNNVDGTPDASGADVAAEPTETPADAPVAIEVVKEPLVIPTIEQLKGETIASPCLLGSTTEEGVE